MNLRQAREPSRGFTLIELMVAVAIVGILATIAIPSYGEYVRRSNRSAAEQLLTMISNRQAQYLLDARAYASQIGAGGLNITGTDGWTCEATCTNSRYTVVVTVDDPPALGFSITATPTGSQTSDGTLTLTSDGGRTRLVAGVDKGW
jgi:type IV pilus assembly protein PilE